MRTAADIATEYQRRVDSAGPARANALRVRDAYNGDLVVPVEGAESPAVANLVLTGVDQTAARIASVLPDIIVPPDTNTQGGEKKAQRRRDVYRAWWQANRLPNMLRRRARFFIAYGSAPAIIGVDWDHACPRWRIVNPLQFYPSDDSWADLVPANSITSIQRTAAWLRAHYPDQARTLGRDVPDTAAVILLEYNDAEQTALVLAGVATTSDWTTPSDTPWGTHVDPVPLEVVPNRVGRPLAVLPQRAVLDRTQGQFDQMIGMYEAQARLTALSIIATEKSVFPDTYLVSAPGDLAQFVEGPHDGRTGMVNIVRGGNVTELQSAPGFNTNPMIDRLERGQRVTAAVPPEFGGEYGTNIRTGRRGDAILSAVLDFPILEAQEAFAEALAHETRLAAATVKTYFSGRTLSTSYTLGDERIGTTFDPGVLLTSDACEVSYPVTGADMNQLIVSMGQRIGLGTMSRRTAAELDPLISNPEKENDRITAEALDTAMMASIQTAAQSGQLPPQVLARVSELVRYDRRDLADAVDTATAEYAANQQAQQQAQQPMSPEMAGGPLSAEAPPGVAEAPQGLQNLAGLLRGLRASTTNAAYAGATGQPYRQTG